MAKLPATTSSNPKLTTDAPRQSHAIEESLDRLESLSAELLHEDAAQTADAIDDWRCPPLTYRLPDPFLLSVVMPAYNEEDTLAKIVGRVLQLPIPLELVIVDDCSRDRTPQIIEQLAQHGAVRSYRHEVNQGKGAALRTGFEQALGDVVIVQDADLEYDPADILNVIQPIVEERADVVYGSRFLQNKEQDPSFLHRFGNRLLTTASNVSTGLRLTDMETCYKAFRREVLADLDIQQNRFGFEPEITAKVARRKHRLVELPIRYHARGYEEGKKIGMRDAFNAFYCIVRYALAD